MANSTVQVIKIDPEVHRTLKALTRAINRQTDVMIDIEQKRRQEQTTNVFRQRQDELDEKIHRESGASMAGADRRLLEDAVAEGDDPSILEQ